MGTKATKHFTMFVRRLDNPFTECESRIAYHGQLAKKTEDLGQTKSAVICKTFKHNGKGTNDIDQYLKQMEVPYIAHFLAKEYNKDKNSHCAEIHILPVCFVEEYQPLVKIVESEGTGTGGFKKELKIMFSADEYPK